MTTASRASVGSGALDGVSANPAEDKPVPPGPASAGAAARHGMAARKPRLPSLRFRLTLAGWLFLLVSIMVGVAAIRSQTALVLVLFGAMMGALHVSAIIARRIVSPVRLRRDVPDHVWQNQTVHLGYYLHNQRRGSGLAICVRELAPTGLQCAAAYCVHLPAGGMFRAGGRFTAVRRGRISLRDVRISTVFPFGLVEAARDLPMPSTLAVWPARGLLKRRLLHHGAVETSQAAASPVQGGQDEFFGLRDYRPDDNPRWIHWRRSATRDALVVREMSRPFPEILWVVLDTWRADASDTAGCLAERDLRFAATLIEHAISRDYQVGLALAYDKGPRLVLPAAGRGQLHALLECLTDADANTHVRLTDTVSLFRRGQLRRAQVVLVTRSAGRLPGPTLASLMAQAGHLRVIDDAEIGSYFEDDPLAVKEGAIHAATKL